MKNKKKCGYFWRCNRLLKEYFPNNIMTLEDFAKFPPKKRKWIIRHFFEFRIFVVCLFFLVCSSWSFQGVGECEKLLSDYAQLTNKSVFLPHTLQGQCVVQSEKHFPLILKNAGFNYSEKNGFLKVTEIPPYKEKEKEPWKPESKFYDVEFVFVNMGNALDCGFRMDDIFLTLRNLDYNVSVGLALGCPALDEDGSFAFRVNAHLLETWTYSHGIEQQRQKAQITSSTGAVTNEYDWITTGLNISLSQTEKGVSFSLKYTGRNGSVTTATGGVVDEVKATITDEYVKTRKLWAFAIGKEKILAQYTLLLRITPRIVQP